MKYYIFQTLLIFCRVLEYSMLAYCILSWFARGTKVFEILGRFIAPFVAPFAFIARKINEKIHSPFDFSVLFAFLALGIIERLLARLYYVI